MTVKYHTSPDPASNERYASGQLVNHVHVTRFRIPGAHAHEQFHSEMKLAKIGEQNVEATTDGARKWGFEVSDGERA